MDFSGVFPFIYEEKLKQSIFYHYKIITDKLFLLDLYIYLVDLFMVKKKIKIY